MSEKGKAYFKELSCGVIEKEADGSFSFQYTDDAPAISLTLPVQKEAYKSEELFPFFDGLIPEGWLLNIAQKNWKIPKNDRMALLLTTCQDCIGAAHVLDDLPQPKQNDLPENFIKHTRKTIAKTSDRCLICMEDLPREDDLYHIKCAKNLFGFAHAPLIDVSSGDLEKLALLQINQRLTLTGVQKKLSLSPAAENKKERLTVVGFDGRFILKPSSEEFPEMAAFEHISMKLAEHQGLHMAACGLVYLASGELAYVTRRFDRQGLEKIQMEDFCQLAGKSTDKKYSGSSELLGKVIEQYSTSPGDDKVTLFQVLLFSYWIGNADMHLKNFSLWRDPASGLIRMSPGYDYLCTRLLISANEDKEELALPVNGKKNRLKWSDFLALGANLRIPTKVLKKLRDKMLDSYPEAEALIYKSFLSDAKKDEFVELIAERSKKLLL